MQGLKYLMMICDARDTEFRCDEILDGGAFVTYSKMCEGTAVDSRLEIAGIARTEKSLIAAFMSDEAAEKAMLKYRKDFSVLNGGIVFTVQADGFAGKTSLYEMTGLSEAPKTEVKEDKNGEGKEMNENLSKYVLIVTILDRGNSEKAMDAARSAGARGGTVSKVRGTGKDRATFFGVAISREKSMVYIVAERFKRDIIMKALLENVGPSTDAHGVVFSLPVDAVAGIKTDAEDNI